MNAGTLWCIIADLKTVAVTMEILRPDGTFDQSKLDTLAEDLMVVAAVERVLKTYGLAIPDRLDKLIALLPVFVQLVG